MNEDQIQLENYSLIKERGGQQKPTQTALPRPDALPDDSEIQLSIIDYQDFGKQEGPISDSPDKVEHKRDRSSIKSTERKNEDDVLMKTNQDTNRKQQLMAKTKDDRSMEQSKQIIFPNNQKQAKGHDDDHIQDHSHASSLSDVLNFRLKFSKLRNKFNMVQRNLDLIIQQIKLKNEETLLQTSKSEDILNDRMILDKYYKNVYDKTDQLEQWLKDQQIIDKHADNSFGSGLASGVSRISRKMTSKYFDEEAKDEEELNPEYNRYVTDCEILWKFLLHKSGAEVDYNEIIQCYIYLKKVQQRVRMIKPFKNLQSYQDLVNKEKDQEGKAVLEGKGKSSQKSQKLEIHKQQESMLKIKQRGLIEGIHSIDLNEIKACFIDQQKMDIMFEDPSQLEEIKYVQTNSIANLLDSNIVANHIQPSGSLGQHLSVDHDDQHTYIKSTDASENKCFFQFLPNEDPEIGLEQAFHIKVFYKFDKFEQQNIVNGGSYLGIQYQSETKQAHLILEKDPEMKCFWMLEKNPYSHQDKSVKIKLVLWPRGRIEKTQEHIVQEIESSYIVIDQNRLTLKQNALFEWSITQLQDDRIKTIIELIQKFKFEAQNLSKKMDIDEIVDQLKNTTFNENQHNMQYKESKMQQGNLLSNYENREFHEGDIRYQEPFPQFAGIIRDDQNNIDLCCFNNLSTKTEAKYQIKGLISNQLLVGNHDIQKCQPNHTTCKLSIGQLTHYGRKSKRVYVYSQFQPYLYIYENEIHKVDLSKQSQASQIQGKNWFQQMQYAKYNPRPGTLCKQSELEDLPKDQFQFDEDTYFACFGENQSLYDRKMMLWKKNDASDNNIPFQKPQSDDEDSENEFPEELECDLLPSDQEKYNDNLKGLLLKNKSLKGIYKFGGCIHSIREVDESNILIAFGVISEDDEPKQQTLMLWNLDRKPEEYKQDIKDVVWRASTGAILQQQTYLRFQQEKDLNKAKTDLIIMRPSDRFSDRDIELDVQKGLFYTLGENCIYKFRLLEQNSVMEKIDKVDVGTRPVALRLSSDKKLAFVVCEDYSNENMEHIIQIVDLDYMTKVEEFHVDDTCEDFALSEDGKLLVTTHEENWRIWKRHIQTRKFQVIHKTMDQSESPFQVEFDNNDIYISFFKKYSRETMFKQYKFEGRNLNRQYSPQQQVRAFEIVNDDTIYIATDRQIQKLRFTFDGIEQKEPAIQRHEKMIVNLFDQLPPTYKYVEYERPKSASFRSSAPRRGSFKAQNLAKSQKSPTNNGKKWSELAEIFGKKEMEQAKVLDEDQQVKFITMLDDRDEKINESNELAVWDQSFNLLYILELLDNIDRIVVIDHDIIAVQNTVEKHISIYQLPSEKEIQRLQDQMQSSSQVQQHLAARSSDLVDPDNRGVLLRIKATERDEPEPFILPAGSRSQVEQPVRKIEEFVPFQQVKIFKDEDDSYYWPVDVDQNDSNRLILRSTTSFFIFKYEDVSMGEDQTAADKSKDSNEKEPQDVYDDVDVEFVKKHYICEIRVTKDEFGYEETEELIHLRIDDLNQISRAVVHQETIDNIATEDEDDEKAKSYLAVITCEQSDKVDGEDLISNTLFIWDITDRKQKLCQAEKDELKLLNDNEEYVEDQQNKPTIVWNEQEGFVLKVKLEFGETNVTNMGFVQINNSKYEIEEVKEEQCTNSSDEEEDQDKDKESEDSDDDRIMKQPKSQVFLWFITRDSDSNFSLFKIYSILDQKVIHQQKFNTNRMIKSVFFDQGNKYIYIIDDYGLMMSDLLWQKQDMQQCLSNFVNSFNLKLEQSHEAYVEIMDHYMSYPQMQNMIHYYAIKDQDNPAREHFEYDSSQLTYCTDINGKTPLNLAFHMSNENVLTTMLNAFESNDGSSDDLIFLNQEDFLVLLDDGSSNANRALENLFVPTRFLDKDDNKFKGQLKHSWFDSNILSIFSDIDKSQIFFESSSKFLVFEDNPIFFRGHMKDQMLTNGVKSKTLIEQPEELLKIEFFSLSFSCQLQAGSKFSEILLNKMAKSPNKDLFRTDCKIILDYKWNQLKSQVYLYNAFLISYIIVLILIQIFGAKIKEIRYYLNCFAFVLTLFVGSLELYQNVLSVTKIIKYKYIAFEDYQNFMEFTGYFLQMVYLALTIIGAGSNQDVQLDQNIFWINILSCLFIFTRGFFLMKIFGPLRPLVRMIKEVMSFLLPFTILLFFSALFFSVEMYILLKKHFNLKINDDDMAQVWDVFKDFLVNLPASGELDGDLVDIREGQNYILYFISMYFQFIIMMNLLIAIIGEKFGIVLEQSIPLDCQERAHFMIEIEEFKGIWRHVGKLCCFYSDKNKDKSKPIYIHYTQYQKDADEEDPEQVEVEGRLRMMSNNLNKNQRNFKKRNTDMDRNNMQIQERLNNLYYKNEQTKKIKELQDQALLDLDRGLAIDEAL